MSSPDETTAGEPTTLIQPGAFHYRLVALCFAIAAVDGYDTQCIAFVAPRLLVDWGLQQSSFGPLFSAGLFGTMLGAVVLGSAADRFGRRTVILASVLLFGAMSLLSVAADTPAVLGVYRFIGGIGLGGVIPNIIALVSEYAPLRYRSRMIVAMFCGFPLGATLGGVVSHSVMANFGWQGVFVIGGVAPLLLAALAWFHLPESAQFRRGSAQSNSGAMSARFVKQDSSGAASLFTDGRTAWTVLLWTLCFAGMLLTYFLINWTPLLLVAAGISEKNAIMAVVLLNAGGILGGLLLGHAMDRIGVFTSLCAALGLGTAGVLAMGATLGTSLLLTLALMCLVGLTVFGSQMNFASLTTMNYPVHMRSTGVGWAMAVGRLGSVVGPLIGGVLVAAGLQAGALISWSALAAGLAAMLVLMMKFRLRKNGRVGASEFAQARTTT